MIRRTVAMIFALVSFLPVQALRPEREPDGARSEQFLPARPGWIFEFPRDHGSHPQFRTEWWYYTGNLRTASGKAYGFELTFFRVGIARGGEERRNPWTFQDVGLAHFAVSDVKNRKFRFYEKMNRISPFLAGAAEGSLDVFNEGWSARLGEDGTMRLQAMAGGDAIDLRLRSTKAPAVHGVNGISVKAEGVGYASHYYSLTRLEAEGEIVVAGRRETCRGTAWMDHEFGSSSLRETQQGWDWFSVQFDNRTELMLYVIRRTDGTPDLTSSGSFVLSDGNVIHLRHDQFSIRTLGKWKSPRSLATYPMGWTIEIPSLDLRATMRAQFPDQELVTAGSTQITYWEGAASVSGSFAGTPVRGEGYVEMTGYDRKFAMP